MYLLLHNKLTVRERLFRIQSVNDPYCVNCMDDAGAIICDREHYFCQCVIVEEVWQTLKEVLRTLGIDCSRYTDLELLSLQLPKSSRDTEIVWIMSNYFHTTWSLLNCGEVSNFSVEKFFGYLKFKYKSYKWGARPGLTIPAFD